MGEELRSKIAEIIRTDRLGVSRRSSNAVADDIMALIDKTIAEEDSEIAARICRGEHHEG